VHVFGAKAVGYRQRPVQADKSLSACNVVGVKISEAVGKVEDRALDGFVQSARR
jgi:hypothetical protein